MAFDNADAASMFIGNYPSQFQGDVRFPMLQGGGRFGPGFITGTAGEFTGRREERTRAETLHSRREAFRKIITALKGSSTGKQVIDYYENNLTPEEKQITEEVFQELISSGNPERAINEIKNMANYEGEVFLNPHARRTITQNLKGHAAMLATRPGHERIKREQEERIAGGVDMLTPQREIERAEQMRLREQERIRAANAQAGLEQLRRERYESLEQQKVLRQQEAEAERIRKAEELAARYGITVEEVMYGGNVIHPTITPQTTAPTATPPEMAAPGGPPRTGGKGSATADPYAKAIPGVEEEQLTPTMTTGRISGSELLVTETPYSGVTAPTVGIKTNVVTGGGSVKKTSPTSGNIYGKP